MTTKLPNIPEFDGTNAAEVVGALKEALEVRVGRRGDQLDAGVTFRDLEALGVVQSDSTGSASSLLSTPVRVRSTLLDGAIPELYDPTKDLTTPPAPSELRATAVFDTVFLSWNMSGFPNQSFWEIWRSFSNDLSSAALIGTSSSQFFTDVVGENRTVYYWVRTVSAAGIKSAWNSSFGTEVTTGIDPAVLIAAIEGQILESSLSRDLATRIDSAFDQTRANVTRISKEVADRTAAINTEIIDRTNAINAAKEDLEAQIDAVENIGEYSPTITYVAGDLARYTVLGLSYIYRAKVTTTGNVPTNTTYWQLVGQYNSLASLTGANFSSITQINLIDPSSTSPSAQAILALKSTVDDPVNGVNATAQIASQLKTEVFPNGTASASRLDTLESTVNNETTGVVATSNIAQLLKTEVFPDGTASASRIDLLTAEVFNGDGSSRLATASALNTVTAEVFPNGTANASRIDLLSAEVFNADGSSRLATASALNTVITEVFPDGTANASRLDTLTAEVFNPNGSSRLATASAVSLIEAEVFPNGTSQASRIDLLTSEVFNPNGTSRLATASALSTIETEVFPNGTSSASRIDGLAAEVFNTDGTARLATAAALSVVTAEVFPDGTSSSSRLDTLTSTVGDQALSISTTQSTVNGVQGKYAVKIDNNGHVSGFGLISELNNGTPSSAFIIRADRFAIVDPASTANNLTLNPSSDTVPFAYVSGIAGVPNGVYIKDAFIQNASITDAKIGSVAAKKITAGYVTASIAFNGSQVYGASLYSGGTTSTSYDAQGNVTGFTANNPTFKVEGGNVEIVSTNFRIKSLSTSTSYITPFKVEGGVVYIDTLAVIKAGDITTAMIQNAQITSAQITSLTAEKIVPSPNGLTIDANLITLDGNVTLDTYYDSSIGRSRLRIKDLGVTTAKIDDLAVTTGKIANLAVGTLKIAGNAITQPEVYTAADVYVPTSSAIVMTNSGVNETYNYVGSGNGDYQFVQEYDFYTGNFFEYYAYVGQGNGDHVRVVTYGAPSFTGAITVIETPVVTVGVDATAAVQIVYYATHDGSIYTYNDSGQHLFMLLDTGAGYRLVAQQQVGLRTDSSADTMASLPIAMTFTARNITTARVKILTGSRRVDLAMGNGSNPCWLRNSTISLLGAKR